MIKNYYRDSVREGLELKKTRSWRYCMALLFGMFLSISSFAQTITIGSGTSNTNGNGSDPIDGYFESMHYQVVYTAAELTTAGLVPYNELTGMGFSISEDYGGGDLLNYSVRIGHTSATNASAHISVPFTTVRNAASYNPTVTAAEVFDMMTFNSNFVWNGVDNIVVDICTGGSNPYIAPRGGVRATSVTNGSRFHRADVSTSVCGIATDTSNGFKPNVQFSYVTGTPPSCVQPTSLTAGSITTSGASLSWTSAGTLFDLEWGVSGFTQGTGTMVSNLATTSYALSSLNGSTSYSFYVRRNCGSSQSVWSGPFSFTTLTPGQIGIGAATSEYLPIRSNYGYNYSQQIYLQSEISPVIVAGQNYITKIRFRQVTAGTTSNYNNWTVYLGNTSKTSFTSTADWVPFSNLSQAYSGVLTIAANSWVEITLQTPFLWDGTSNLVVAVDENSAGYSNSTWAAYPAGTNRAILYNNDTTNPDPATPPVANYGPNASIPQIQFVSTIPPACVAPNSLSATNIGAYAATLGWASGESMFVVEYGPSAFVQGSGTLVNNLTANSFELNGLLANTAYKFYVQANCDTDGLSSWAGPFSFTTTVACVAPTALTASATGSNVNLGWTSLAGQYNIEYGTTGFVKGTGTVVNNLSVNTYQLTGLPSATAYQFYVQANCGVDGLSTWTGPFSFTTPLANDDCSTAITLSSCSGGTQTVSGTTIGSAVDAGYQNCGASPAVTEANTQRGVWYKYIGSNSQVTITSCNTAPITTFDTRITVYSGSCGAFTCVAGNDDMAPVCSLGSSASSEVNFAANLGTEYYIFVHGYQSGTSLSATGNFALTISCAPLCAPATANDECSAPAALVVGTPLSTNNTCSTASLGAPVPTTGSNFATYNDSWYTFNSGGNTAFRISREVTSPVAVGFELYTGACGTLTAVPGTVSLTGATVTKTGLTANTDYLVRVFSTSSASRGDFTLSVSVPTTTIATADCGTTKQEVGYESIDAVSITGAEEYEFKIVNGGFSATVVSPDASVFFSEFAGFQYGTTYDVSVRVKFGAYGAYGATCQVSTTATPTTEMQFLCDDVLPAVNSKVYFKGVPLATAYRFEVTNKVSSAVVTTEGPNRYFYMNTLSNFAYGTEYSVRAQVEVGGTYQPYGDACDITTPAAPTQLRAAYCGVTLTSISANVFANYVTGATAYRFRATNGATVQVYETTTAEPKFAINMLPEALLATTYSVEVAALTGGVWSPYGTACNVTTPASAPLTKLRDAYCGTTLPAINTNVYASYVTGATQYRFRITNGANVQTIESAEPKFMFTSLASYDLGTTYTVDVASFVNGTWGLYGAACNVTTPTAPLTKLRDAYCGVTLNALNSNIYAKSMLGATGFRFKVINDTDTTEEVYETTGMLFRLTYLTTIVPQNGTTYSISVAYNNGTAWSVYGDICTVSTPAAPVARPSVNDTSVSLERLQVKAYPNPFTNDFTVGLNLVSEQSSEIYIYDMTGKMIERTILDANQLEKSGLGSNLPTGIYNVQIIQGNQVHNLKVMKN